MLNDDTSFQRLSTDSGCAERRISNGETKMIVFVCELWWRMHTVNGGHGTAIVGTTCSVNSHRILKPNFMYTTICYYSCTFVFALFRSIFARFFSTAQMLDQLRQFLEKWPNLACENQTH